MDKKKREYRQMKRDVKKTGNRKLRREMARDLERNPEEAAHSEFDYGRDSSAPLNGNDHDTARKRSEEGEEADGE